MPPSPPDSPRPPAAAIVTPRTAALLLALVILLWGANWPVMKLGVAAIEPLTFAALRVVMGAATLFGLLGMLGRLRLPRRADLPIVLTVGLLQIGIYLALINLALGYVDAGRSAILAYTTPLWVVPGAVLLFGERLAGLRLGGFLLGMAGVAVMFNPVALDWSNTSVLLGNGLLMVAALSWAGQILYIRRHRWIGSPLELMPWQLTVSAALLVPLALLVEGWPDIDPTGATIAILVYNGPVATAFCFWAVVTINRALPAITTSLGMLGVPVMGVALSSLALGERISPTNLVGLILIGGGLALVALGEKTRPKSST